MARTVILGATGSLGGYLTEQAIAANHQVSIVVRNPSKLSAEVADRVMVHQADLAQTSAWTLAAMLRGQDAVVNAAGHVTDGQAFVDLIARIVTGLESLPAEDRPVSWFLGGAALLDLDDHGRRGVDLPPVAETYWPHRVNFERIARTALDWRVLCPGPMVHQPALGIARMRVSLDRLPVAMPSDAARLPGPLVLPHFVQRVPEMIVSYADAAALILANLAPAGAMSRHRVGLALPAGMRGEKPSVAAQASAA